MSEAPRPRRFGRRARTAALIFASCVGFLAYARLLFWHASFAVGGSDSSGYANTARLITAGRVVAPVEGLEQLGLPDEFVRVFIPLGFVPGPRPGTMAPLYPPGFPLLTAVAGVVTGWNYGTFVVSPLAALASLFLIYLIARELGASRLFAAAGATVLALCPVFILFAEQPMSDDVAAMWALAAALFALRSRRREVWAAAAGIAFGMAVLVRPSDILLVLPLVFALRWNLRTLLLFAAGASPFAVAYLAWNKAAFGNAFSTGYAATLPEGLAAANFPGGFRHYGLWLGRLLSPIIPAGWLLVIVNRRVAVRDRLFLVLWFAVLFVFYCFWGVDGAWWYTRYLLPALPALILATLLVVRDGLNVTKGGRGAVLRRFVAAAALAVVLAVEVAGIRGLNVLNLPEGDRIYADASRWAEAKVPAGSLIVSMQMSGAIRYYTGLLPVRYDWLDANGASILREKARERGRSLVALVFPSEVEKLQERLPGPWRKIGSLREVSLWRSD